MAYLSEYARKVLPYLDHGDIELTEEVKRAVMKSVDVRSILESWNVRPVLRGTQWTGYCPTHFIHDGHPSHAPKWTMSAETGDSTCFTSDRHENFIEIARKIYRFKTNRETIERLSGGETIEIPYELPSWKTGAAVAPASDDERKENLKRTIDSFVPLFREGRIGRAGLDYFAADGIREDTLRSLHVCSADRGHYAGRCMIPFLDSDNAISGFVAVNVMGREWMVRHNADKWCRINGEERREEAERYFEKNYRKTLYCPGFQSRSHLYGWHEWLDDRERIDDLILVEGERDAIKLLQEGFCAVSIHGTILKREQIQTIRRINPGRVFLGLDMDEPGRRGCEKAYEKLMGEVNQVLVMEFPGGKDPKSFCHDEIADIMSRARGSMTI